MSTFFSNFCDDANLLFFQICTLGKSKRSFKRKKKKKGELHFTLKKERKRKKKSLLLAAASSCSILQKHIR